MDTYHMERTGIRKKSVGLTQGRIQGGGGGVHPARAPPKIGKNMIFLA